MNKEQLIQDTLDEIKKHEDIINENQKLRKELIEWGEQTYTYFWKKYKNSENNNVYHLQLLLFFAKIADSKNKISELKNRLALLIK